MGGMEQLGEEKGIKEHQLMGLMLLLLHVTERGPQDEGIGMHRREYHQPPC